MQRLFVTGTDTEIGKTYVTAGLLSALSTRGLRTIGLKPVASGCTHTEQGLVNDDAVALQTAASVPLTLDQINPHRFAEPVSPHLIAGRQRLQLDVSAVMASLQPVLTAEADWMLMEGYGGWRAPLNESERVSDLARNWGAPVLMVVGMRPGCINHAVLTAEAIQADGLRLAGWVANRIDPGMRYVAENVATLCEAIDAPFIGDVPYRGDPAALLDIDALSATL